MSSAPPPPDYRLILAERGPVGTLRRTERQRARTSLARLIRDYEEGDGPRRLVAILYETALDDLQPTPVRLAAIQMLLDRGFGRPAQLVTVEQSIADGDAGAGDRELERLSDRQLAELMALGEKVRVLLEPPADDGGV